MVFERLAGSLLVISMKKRLWLAILKSHFLEAFFNGGLLTVRSLQRGDWSLHFRDLYDDYHINQFCHKGPRGRWTRGRRPQCGLRWIRWAGRTVPGGPCKNARLVRPGRYLKTVHI